MKQVAFLLFAVLIATGAQARKNKNNNTVEVSYPGTKAIVAGTTIAPHEITVKTDNTFNINITTEVTNPMGPKVEIENGQNLVISGNSDQNHDYHVTYNASQNEFISGTYDVNLVYTASVE
jgi:hypothetical protein